MRSGPIVLSLALAGCVAIPVGGANRNPRFTSDRAPAPTVALDLVACHLSGAPARTAPAPEALAELFQRLGVTPLPVDEPSRIRVCAALTGDRALFADLVSGFDWTAGGGAAPLVRRIARVHAAGSVLIPLTRAHAGCPPREAFFEEDTGPGPGRVGARPACGEDTRVDVGLFLFASDGTLLWRASGTAASPSPESLRPVLEQVTRDVPARP